MSIPIYNVEIDQLLENLSIGSVGRSIANNLYGINARSNNAALPRAKDSYGYTFFTRPQLNLRVANISNYRGFFSLMTNQDASYQRFVRTTLDPRLNYVGGLPCPFVDHQNAFIPILTNSLMSMGGFPDLTVPSYTTDAGLYGEETGFVDGVTNHYESYDVDATFRNSKGNPLIYFFYIWVKYQSLVFEGILHPYMDMISENEIDYNTRIYRIVLDEQKRFVRYMGATGASYPQNVPTGSLFDFNADKPFNDSNTEISIRFKSFGFLSFDDILKKEFNETAAIFNESIRKLLIYDLSGPTDESRTRDDPIKAYTVPGTGLVKVPHLLHSITQNTISANPYYALNHRSYPYINLATGELEWWADEKIFKNILARASADNRNNEIEKNKSPQDKIKDAVKEKAAEAGGKLMGKVKSKLGF